MRAKRDCNTTIRNPRYQSPKYLEPSQVRTSPVACLVVARHASAVVSPPWDVVLPHVVSLTVLAHRRLPGRLHSVLMDELRCKDPDSQSPFQREKRVTCCSETKMKTCTKTKSKCESRNTIFHTNPKYLYFILVGKSSYTSKLFIFQII